MSCKFCDLERITSREDFYPYADYLVGEWAFTKDDDLTHHSQGRISLWHSFDDGEWALLVLIDDSRSAANTPPAVAQFHPKVCPMCGRKLNGED